MSKKLLYDKPLFLKSMWGSLTIICLSVYGLINSSKKKDDLTVSNGIIEFVAHAYQDLPVHDAGKYRYIKLNKQAKPFEVFIGKDVGDFKPKFEQVDRLLPGSQVSVYYIPDAKEEKVIRLVHTIESSGQPYFIAGNSLAWIAGICLIAGVALAIVLMILKAQRKII